MQTSSDSAGETDLLSGSEARTDVDLTNETSDDLTDQPSSGSDELMVDQDQVPVLETQPDDDENEGKQTKKTMKKKSAMDVEFEPWLLAPTEGCGPPAKGKRLQRARAWVATVWCRLFGAEYWTGVWTAYEKEFKDNAESKDFKFPVIKFCAQLERAPTTGKEHFQCYMYFDKGTTYRQVATFLAGVDGKTQTSKDHLDQIATDNTGDMKGAGYWKKRAIKAARSQPANGNCKQNLAYCTKDESAVTGQDAVRIVYGNFAYNNGEGRDRKLGDAVESISRNADDYASDPSLLIRQFPQEYIRYGPRLHDVAKAFSPNHKHRKKKHAVTCITGSTGTGKTFFANWITHTCDMTMWRNFDKTFAWFNGYENQQVILVDDFDYNFASMKEMLRLLDACEQQVQIKHGSIWLQNVAWIFTSNEPLESWYPEEKKKHRASWEAFQQRFTGLIDADKILEHANAKLAKEHKPAVNKMVHAWKAMFGHSDPFIWTDVVDPREDAPPLAQRQQDRETLYTTSQTYQTSVTRQTRYNVY